MSVLSTFDVVVLLMMALGAVAGVARGFVMEVLSLLAWAAAILAVRYFYAPGKVFAERVTGTEAGGAVLSAVLIFVVTFVVVRSIAGSLGKRSRQSAIGPLDRVLGMGFGGIKGLLAASVLFLFGTMAFDVLDPGRARPQWLDPHRTAPLVEVTSKAMVAFYEERRARAYAEKAAKPAA